MTNRATGRPVKAVVQYYPFRDNPHLKECPDASFLDNNLSDEAEFPTDADGHFRAVALPGGGILTVRTTGPGYLTAEPLSPEDAGNVLHAANFEYQMNQYQALVPINPGDGEKSGHPRHRRGAGTHAARPGRRSRRSAGSRNPSVRSTEGLTRRRGRSAALNSPSFTPSPERPQAILVVQPRSSPLAACS